MNQEEATHRANELLSQYTRPEEARWAGFTAVMQEYGFGSQDELTKEEADKMLIHIMEQQAPASSNGVIFSFKTAWIEDQNGQGRILAEYTRKTKDV